MHKITQSHFDVAIETPEGGSAIADVVDEIGTRIHEYANQEDVTADFEIVFEIGSPFSVKRTSPYVLKVVLDGTESADDVLDAIADDLYMIYDEMDSDYTDDAYDLRIDMDITPGRRRPTPPTPPTPPSGDGDAPDASVAEAEEALEEAIEDRLRRALSGSTRLEDRATVARMNRIIKNAAIEDVQFNIEFGDEYSVTEDESGEVQVTLVDKRTGAETVAQVISDIAQVMTYATRAEVDAEVDQAVSEAALDEAEDSEEVAEKVEGIVEKLEIEDWEGAADVSEEELEDVLKVKILEQLARDMLIGTLNMKPSESEGEEPSNLYTSILDTPPPLPSNAADYSETLEVVRGNSDLMTKLQIPENRRNDADLMLSLLVRLNNNIYRERVGKKLVDEDEEAYYHSLLEMVDEADFINAVADSLDHFNGAMDFVEKDTVIGDEVGLISGMSLSERKKALIVNLANEAYVRKAFRFFTDEVRTSSRKSYYARAADAILDLAVELHNRTSRPANAWSRRNVRVGDQYRAQEASDLKKGPARGKIAEVYFQGIQGDAQAKMKSPVNVEGS